MNYNIYLADFDENFVEGLSNLLQKVLPHSKIYKFYDGLDLLGVLQKETKISLIISEYNLPNINSIQILKKLRNELTYKDSYFLIYSSQSDKEFALKAIQNGANDILYKPFSSDSLLIKLKQATLYLDKIFEIESKNTQILNLNKAFNSVYSYFILHPFLLYFLLFIHFRSYFIFCCLFIFVPTLFYNIFFASSILTNIISLLFTIANF